MAATTRTQQPGFTMSSTSRASQPAPAPPPSMPAALPYKSHLTPFLHRQFTSAASLTLGLCYLSATLLSPSSSWLWFWFPIGPTGLRTFLLFVPALAVFIVRVMNMHAGQRTTTNSAETLLQRVMEVRTYATLGWYVFSAWMFGEVYIWSRGAGANLGWVDAGRAYERPRVNENPVLLRSIFVSLAVGQAVLHLARDYDRVQIEETEARQGREEEASRVPESIQLLTGKAQTIAGRVARLVIPGIVFSIPAYFLFLRGIAWHYLAYPIARILLIRDLPPNAGPTAITHPSTLAWQTFTASTLLVALWELSNAVFTIYVSALPLKRGEPLTAEVKDAHGAVLSRSRDPNGSLLRGFRAKKDVPRTFAFWELYLICTNPRYTLRRKTIFTEVDRQPSTTWAEISSFCLEEIAAISTRIQVAQLPPGQPSGGGQVNPQRQIQEALIARQQQGVATGLPRIAKQGVYSDRAVVLPSAGARGGALQAVGGISKAVGQSPSRQNGHPVAQYGRKALAYGVEKAQAGTGNNEVLSPSAWQGAVNGYTLDVLRTPLGEPFRQTFARRVRAVVLGVPVSNGINIVHASRSLTSLAVASLQEDNYGQAAKSIASIVRIYTATLLNLRNFIADLPPHWTDVGFHDSQRDAGLRELQEVGQVMEVLRAGLEEVVLAFGEYAGDVGLSREEMRRAREVVGTGAREKEMEQVG
ncbi:hypothetical protein LTR53_012323 [Teratosphaeriaceae sp. CCFEE 6253]|nr:hypothetical protein LTR53_012323 [Teratosphaeriaceae sp. CCFEE 6253]